MKTEPISPTMGTLLLANGILGIITAIPFPLLGYPISLAILGIAIYQLVKLPKTGHWKTSPILLTVAVALQYIAVIGIFATVGSVAALGSMSDSLSDGEAMSMVGGVLLWGVVAFASWVIRIVGTVYAFTSYSRAKRETAMALQAQAAAATAAPSVMTDAPTPQPGSAPVPQPVPTPVSTSESATVSAVSSESASAAVSGAASESASASGSDAASESASVTGSTVGNASTSASGSEA